jgi:hypothetical protein
MLTTRTAGCAPSVRYPYDSDSVMPDLVDSTDDDTDDCYDSDSDVDADNVTATETEEVTAHFLALTGMPHVDLWCVDGASTTNATYDRDRCINLRPCRVKVLGPDSSSHFVVTEMGDVAVSVFDRDTGVVTVMLVTNVLVHANFPFHVLSEIIMYEKGCTAVKEAGSWQFYAPGKRPIFHASQQLLTAGGANSNSKLYFLDGPDPSSLPSSPVSVLVAYSGNQEQRVPQQALQQQQQHCDVVQKLVPARAQPAAPVPATRKEPKINTSRNMEMLLELHCAHDHRNFRDIAAKYKLSLPIPAPECWACLMAKPKLITHDRVSTRQSTRPLADFAADAKGPMSTPTPEGYRYYFVIVCLFSSYHWVVLAKSQSEWKRIWPAFVKRIEAKTGSERSVASILTDGHTVHASDDIKARYSGLDVGSLLTVAGPG